MRALESKPMSENSLEHVFTVYMNFFQVFWLEKEIFRCFICENNWNNGHIYAYAACARRKTQFKVYLGRVLSSITSPGDLVFNLKKVEIRSKLQDMIERSYIKCCVEVRVPTEKLKDQRRFWELLGWTNEIIQPRQKLVKIG